MAAWELRVTDIRQGLVTEIDITAQRKCGRVERLTARQFPAGWRMNTSGIPADVARDALRLAREIWD